MIFLTVGSELPFDRLVHAVDTWCESNKDTVVFGQIGEPCAASYLPRHFEWRSFISPEEYRRYYDNSTLIVAHAGMGSIITALVKAKPILIMPRRAAFKETRNDHQVATAKMFATRKGILVAEDESRVGVMLDQWKTIRDTLTIESAGPYAQERLLETIRNFIFAAKDK